MNTRRQAVQRVFLGGPGTSVRQSIERHQAIVMAVALIAALAISSAWLAFPYLMEGRGIMSGVGSQVQEGRRAKAFSIGQFLTRVAPGPGEADVDVLYATPEYFEVADKARVVATYRPDRYHVFVINETTHVNDLPPELPKATLLVDGKPYASADVEGPTNVAHHRSVVTRFHVLNAEGQRIIGDGARQLELRLTSAWDIARTPRSAVWQLPLTYPPELLQGDRWTLVMILGLSAGLLSFVLTPCLLQLIVIYIATLTGFSAEESMRPEAAGRRMLLIALAFVLGFSGLFTLAGAVIGYAGKEVQLFLAEWSREISIGAGIVVIALGLWVGVRSRAPLVCKIPRLGVAGSLDRRGIVRSALMAAGFTLGCVTCFGGAIIATLLVYVGTLGSPAVGAALMLTFSLGVAVPFLLAAMFLSHVLPLLTRLTRYAPYLGFASMIVIVAFGTVLVTDNFHVFSSFIYPFLGLGGDAVHP